MERRQRKPTSTCHISLTLTLTVLFTAFVLSGGSPCVERIPKLVAFVGCRSGSERLPNKCTIPFDDENRSLLDRRMALLEVLLADGTVDEIVFSSDAAAYLDAARAVSPNTVLHRREPFFASSNCSTSEYFQHVAKVIVGTRGSHILYSQVTHPLMSADDFRLVVRAFCEHDTVQYDASVAVEEVSGHFMFDKQPINFDPSSILGVPLILLCISCAICRFPLQQYVRASTCLTQHALRHTACEAYVQDDLCSSSGASAGTGREPERDGAPAAAAATGQCKC